MLFCGGNKTANVCSDKPRELPSLYGQSRIRRRVRRAITIAARNGTESEASAKGVVVSLAPRALSLATIGLQSAAARRCSARPISHLWPKHLRRPVGRCSSAARRSGCVWSERSPSNRLPRQPHLAALGSASGRTDSRAALGRLLPQRRTPGSDSGARCHVRPGAWSARAVLWPDLLTSTTARGQLRGRHDSVREPHTGGHRRLVASLPPPSRRPKGAGGCRHPCQSRGAPADFEKGARRNPSSAADAGSREKNWPLPRVCEFAVYGLVQFILCVHGKGGAVAYTLLTPWFTQPLSDPFRRR